MAACLVVAGGKITLTAATSLVPGRPPMLVEDAIRRIEEASDKFVGPYGRILRGNTQKLDAWEKEHKIKLHWNNWFDVSFAPLFSFLRLDSDHPAKCDFAAARPR